MTRGNSALLVLALAALTACTDPRAGTLPPPTPAPASATTAAPTTAAPTTAPDDDGGALVDAATAFYETLERAARDPGRGADRVERLLHESCDCTRIVSFLRDQASRGHRIERPVAVVGPTATPRRAGGTVFLTLRQGAGRVLSADGRVVERLKPTVERVVVDFRRIDGVLLVTQIATRS